MRIFLVNICFSFSDDGFWLSEGDAVPVNGMQAKNRLLQTYDETVTIR
jgi:hypothetical protein